MAFLLLVAVWAAVATAAVFGALLSFHILKGTFRRKLESEEAKWHLRHQQDSPATVIENISLGWLNLLTQSLWTPVIEKHVAGLTAELLSKVFLEVIAKNSQKAPWKFLDCIEVEELSFGLVPPSFQVAQAKFDPAASMLTISVDVRFTSSSAQAVLLVRSKAVGVFAPVTVRLEVTHLKLRGRLRLGLLLGQEVPGIQGVYYSFTSPPHLDVGVRPLGLPLPAVLPGIDTALRGVITKLISRRMVEPQRRYLDVHRIYLNKHIARVGGPGGLLRVTVICASSLIEPTQPQQQQQAAAEAAAGTEARALESNRSKNSRAAASANSAATKQLSSYCEVVFGRSVLRTPIVHHATTADAAWNWQFSVALSHELSVWPAAAAGSGTSSTPAAANAPAELSLLVFDAQTVGQPILLGKTKVGLVPLQLQPNGPARTLLLPLRKAASSRASLQVVVQWLKSTKQPLSPQQQQQQQMRRLQQGQRAPAQPSTAAQQQQHYAPAANTWQAPPLSQPQAAAAAAAAANAPQQEPTDVQVSGKSVSWQDKAQLRVHSAASAAKQSIKQLVSKPEKAQGAETPARSSSSASAAAAADAAAAAAGVAGVAATVVAAAAGSSAHPANHTEQLPWGGPWANTADEVAAGGEQQEASQAALVRATQQQAPAGAGAAAAASSKTQESPRTSGPAAPAARVSRSSSSHSSSSLAQQQQQQAGSSWLKGWGAWLWGDMSAQELPAAAAARSSSSTAAGMPAAAYGGSSSPWPIARPDEESDGEDSSYDSGLQGPGDGSRSSSPLVLLSHVVHMQKELEQQRQQLEAMQQQLEHTTNSYQRLKQVCRQRGRAALMQGARFLLHNLDGSTQHVLLYLSHVGSTRGVQQSRFGRQQQQHSDPGLMLVIAALPETHREARMAFGRLAAGAADGQAPPAGATGDAAEGQKHPASSGGSAVSAQGRASAAGSLNRMSAFGSVGAGLRLRLQRGTMLQMGYESGKFPRSVLQVLTAVPASQLVGVVRGNTHFAVPVHGGSACGGVSSSGIVAAECFSLLVQESSTVTAINLQLPPVGNGRCLDEWLLALRDVAGPVEPINAIAIGLLAAATATQRGDAAAATAAGAALVAQGQHQAAGHQPGGSTGSSRRRITVPAGGGLSGPAPASAVSAAAGSNSPGQQPAQERAGGAEVVAVAGVAEAAVVRQGSDGNAQSQAHAQDWVLPSAAAVTPTPWLGATKASSGAGAASSSSSSSSDDDDDDDGN